MAKYEYDSLVENPPAKNREGDKPRPMISLVIPCYNEAEVLHLFYPQLKRTLESLAGIKHEIIFVDDGSGDDTLAQLNQLAEEDECVRVCSLSRNYGHQIALTAGMDAASGEALITLDGDLQHPPSLIPQMIDKWRQGYDIVSAVRDDTEGVSWFKKFSSRGFYYIVNSLSETYIPPGAADFNLLDRRVYSVLQNMPERHRFLRGMTSWLGFHRAFIPYIAPQRAAGVSKYTLWKMINLAFDAVCSFSAVPLRLATRVGIIVTLLGFLYLIWILGRMIILHDTVQGWASLIGVTLILGGCNLLFIGLIGQYLARIFDEVKHRPIYVLKQKPADATVRQREIPATENIYHSF